MEQEGPGAAGKQSPVHEMVPSRQVAEHMSDICLKSCLGLKVQVTPSPWCAHRLWFFEATKQRRSAGITAKIARMDMKVTLRLLRPLCSSSTLLSELSSSSVGLT